MTRTLVMAVIVLAGLFIRCGKQETKAVVNTPNQIVAEQPKLQLISGEYCVPPAGKMVKDWCVDPAHFKTEGIEKYLPQSVTVTHTMTANPRRNAYHCLLKVGIPASIKESRDDYRVGFDIWEDDEGKAQPPLSELRSKPGTWGLWGMPPERFAFERGELFPGRRYAVYVIGTVDRNSEADRISLRAMVLYRRLEFDLTRATLPAR